MRALSRLYCGDCLEVMRGMDDNTVDLIATDPPYYKVKSEAWDRQWDTREGFLSWIGELCVEWQRILRPNGSLYVFASSAMLCGVQVEIERSFSVVNRITWAKPPFSTKAEMFRKSDLRSYFPVCEYLVFAEHYGADNMAKGEAGYAAKCDELRGFVFEPLLRYMRDEFASAALPRAEVDEHFRTANVSQYWLQPRGFIIPTPERWDGLRALRQSHFRREYEDLRREYEDLRREYEDLRREYEDLRRPFSVTADVPYTDVWDFPTVNTYPGKHPCEKPLAMMEHIVTASSRPGAVVLDCFMGSGSTIEAAEKHGRIGIGIEKDPTYFEQAKRRIEAARHVATQGVLEGV